MKKILLIIALLISGLGLNAQSVIIDDLEFTVTSETPAECEVSGYSGEPTDVTIPSTVTISGKEYTVTSIGYLAFSDCSSLTSIEIPSGVTYIGDRAFIACSSLTSIEIPSGVTSIGYEAFYGCSSLTSVIFGENSQLSSIGGSAFEGCSSLTSLEIPSGVTSIGNYAFSGCSSLTSIEIPSGVTSIGAGAFSGCSSLTSIELPSGVTSIEGLVFYNCSSLTSIVVESGNTVYDSRDNCNAIIETVTNTLIVGCQNTVIPNTVTSIGDYAFSGRSSLTSIEIPSGVTSIGDRAFDYCSSLTSIDFGENSQLTSIGVAAFNECSSLTSIEIPSGVTSIENGTFYYCSSLTSIEIPSGVTSIGEDAFYECSSLTSVTFGENSQLTSIGDFAFYKCSSLTSIEIPSGVTSIGDYAFSGCSSLTSIELPSGVTSIGEWAFYKCSSLTSIEIPSGVTSIGYYAFSYCSSLTSIDFGENSQLSSIGVDAFFYCSSLTSIEIPSGVTLIREGAFLGCSSLTSIEIPSGVTSIGDRAFYNCSKLKSIICWAEDVPEIPYQETFVNCPSSMTIYVPASSVEKYQSTSLWNDFKIVAIGTPQTEIFENSVLLTWDNCALDYNVYLEDSMIANVTTNTYWIDNLKPSTDYCFTITPICKKSEYEESANICVKTHDIKISTPTKLTATTKDEQSVSLNWEINDVIFFSEDFENYPIGDKIAQSSNTEWTTWSNAPGSSEDAQITELNGNKCLHITQGVDQVLLLGNNTSKYYEVEFDIFVPNEKSGYFNVLHHYNGTDSKWALQSYLHLSDDGLNNIIQNSGHGVLHAGSNGTADVPCVYDEWMHFRICIDVKADKAQYYYSTPDVEEILVCEWQWSKDSFGNSVDGRKLDAMNFFAPLQTSEFYIDNIEVSNKMIKDVSYNIYRNDEFVTNVTNTDYIDSNLESYTDYCYMVTAVRNETESEKSEPACAKTLNPDPENPGEGGGDEPENPNPENPGEGGGDEPENPDPENPGEGGGDEPENPNPENPGEGGGDEPENPNPENPGEGGGDEPEQPVIPAVPANLEATPINTSSIIITWNVAENALSYNVYRDGKFVINVGNPTYTDKELEYDTKYCYTVTSVNGNEESNHSEMVCVKTLGESIEELTSSLLLYPNPVNDKLYIETQTLTLTQTLTIEIYDIYGRCQVTETPSHQACLVVDVTDLKSGVYFVKIVTSEGETVKRFVKK